MQRGFKMEILVGIIFGSICVGFVVLFIAMGYFSIPAFKKKSNKSVLIRNLVRPIETYYLRPDKTVDIVVLSHNNEFKVVYIYNYKGIHYRVFSSLQNFLTFCEKGYVKGLFVEFTQESVLCSFLLNFNFTKD